MAITLRGANAIYEGLSTDEKPSDVPVNTRFFELDTGDEYFTEDGSTWTKIGGDADPTAE